MQLTAMNYYGGKARADFRRWLIPKIPYDKDGLYVEPFAGMLGVLLARPQCKTEVVSDLDANITNWWQVVKEHPDELEHLIRYTPKCRRTFDECVKGIEDKSYQDDMIKWAWATYTILQHGVSHGMMQTGYSIHYTDTRKRDFASTLNLLAERVKDVQVENTDALVILNRIKDISHAVIYCDPPYLTAWTQPYTNDDIDIDAFTDMFLSQKGRVAISGYKNEWDHLGWYRHEWNTKVYKINHVQNHDSESQERTECLWTNYDPKDDQLNLF